MKRELQGLAQHFNDLDLINKGQKERSRSVHCARSSWDDLQKATSDTDRAKCTEALIANALIEAVSAHVAALDAAGDSTVAIKLHELAVAANDSLERPANEIEAPAALDIERYPLVRCAQIAASMARRKEERTDILKKNELEKGDWPLLARHWRDFIKSELEVGKTAPLDAYDDAYVAQLEVERGPIEPDQYVRLCVQAERGKQADTLAELDLPKGSFQRIQRVWLRKIATDKSLAREVRRLMNE